MSEMNDEFVPVPVPRQHVMAVYGFLAQLESGETATPSDNGYPTVTWTEQDLREFANSDTKMARRVSHMMDVLAERPGQKLSLNEVAERLDTTPEVVSGNLSRLTNHVRTRLGRNNWPFVYHPGGPPAHYSMDEQIAGVWKRVRDQ